MATTTIGDSARTVVFMVSTSIRSFSHDDGEPSLGPAFRACAIRELEVGVQLKCDRLDGFDFPAVGEDIVELLPRYLRDDVALFIGTSTHQEELASVFEYPRQSAGVAPSIIVGEDMEQAGVDHAGEPPAPF